VSERWAILVVEPDGETHYMRHGVDDGPIAVYTSRFKAEHDADFLRDGLGDEVQSVSVVRWKPGLAHAG